MLQCPLKPRWDPVLSLSAHCYWRALVHSGLRARVVMGALAVLLLETLGQRWAKWLRWDLVLQLKGGN